MSKRSKRHSAEVVRMIYNTRINNHYYQNRYKEAFKAATLKHQQVGSKDNFQGQKGTGIHAIVNEANSEMLTSPNDVKLTQAAIHSAISRGEFGVSPPKRGRKPTIDPVLTYALATHSTMMQVSREGEALATKMKAVLSMKAVPISTIFGGRHGCRIPR